MYNYKQRNSSIFKTKKKGWGGGGKDTIAKKFLKKIHSSLLFLRNFAALHLELSIHFRS